MNKRRWLLWVLIASFAWLVISRFNEIEELAETLSQGIWLWLLAAAGLQMGYHVMQAKVYQAAFATVGVRSRLWPLVPVVLGHMFINAVAPSGGAAGLALFVDDAAQRGESGPRAAAGTLLALIGIYASFDVILVAGLAYLHLDGRLRSYELVISLGHIVFTLVLGGLLALGLKRPPLLRYLLSRLQRLINGIGTRFKRPGLLESGWAAETAREFTRAAGAIGTRPGNLFRILFWGIIAHLVNAACLYAVFFAFRQPVTPLVAVVGYAIGHLFVIVAPTPQGVGFVETIMPVALSSLDVPKAVATVVVLAYRGLSFWLTLLLGFLLLQRLKSLGTEERSLTEAWRARVVALVTALMGIVNVLSAIEPGLAQGYLETVQEVSPLGVQRGGQVAAVLSGFALLLLAQALWRRKRTAWAVTLLVLIVSAISHVLRTLTLDYRTVLTLLLAGWLFVLRPHFHARSDPPSVKQGLQVLLASLFFVLAYGSLGVTLVAQASGRDLARLEAVWETVQMMAFLGGPAWLVAGEAGRFFMLSIYVISGATLAYAAFMLARPVLVRRPASPAERARARAIITTYGGSPLARQALQADKSYFFTPAGAVVAFELLGRTAITLGDPIGPEAEVPAAIAQFGDHCARNDWMPAFYQALPDHEDAYASAGFDTVPIGREGIVDLATFDLGDATFKPLRVAVNRLLKRGYRAEVITPPLADDLVRDLRFISDAWLTLMHSTERAFALGSFDDALLARHPVAVTYTPAGVRSAFVTVVPGHRPNELAVDMLRHRPHVADGTIAFLLVTLLQWARMQAYTSLNLGMSSLDGDDTPQVWMSRYLYDHINRFNGFDGSGDLNALKAQLHPDWLPRYLAYPGASSLPAVWAAVIRASAGDDALWHRVRQMLRLSE